MMKTYLSGIVGLWMVVTGLFGGSGGHDTTANSRYIRSGMSNLSVETMGLASRNIRRAMAMTDTALAHYFSGSDMAMARFYNPETGERSEERASVWMYTSAIEAVVAILDVLKVQAATGDSALYATHFPRYAGVLDQLVENLGYYQGTFELTSFTQTRQWTVYGVNRSTVKGKARVDGIHNVYDDQEWLVRELLQAGQLTGHGAYVELAEYLTDYVLDGWDCSLDETGRVHGGIPWGPGYVTKHACSNGPFVSPLVWLHERYKNRNDSITYRYIAPDGQRKTTRMHKGDYYLRFAEAVYQWQKAQLLREDGVYADMRGGCRDCRVAYEEVDGVRFRAHTPLPNQVGRAYSYNSGTMLSGAADLYRVTGNPTYLTDLKTLGQHSFNYFARLGKEVPGYYSYDVSGFSNWFNGVLLRGWVDASPWDDQAAGYIQTFQQNLDYGYEHHLYQGFLPHNLLRGWDDGWRQVEGMFAFAFAAEYAVLARYTLEKSN